MRKWTFDYKLEGSIDIYADTSEEAREEFYTKTEQEIIEHCYMGTEITDVTSVEIDDTSPNDSFFKS